MAESFKNQVDALTGFASTEDLALADWLTAGARYVLNAMPLSKLSRVASNTNFTNSQDAEGKRIISVLRKDANNSNRYMPCRELEPHQMGTVHDSAYMEYATTSDPAYIIHNQVINTFPESAASNDSRVVGINTDITVADSATSIDNFPDEAEYSVVLYAARNAVERLMNNIQTNSDTTLATALGLINTQVDEAVVLISTGSGDNAIVNKLALVETNISNAATEIGLAKAEATEIATQTDNSGDINTALIAMNAAVDKFQAASGDPALYGDEDIYTTGVGFTKVKDALDNAQKIVDDGANSPTGNAAGDAATYLYTEEDVELMNGALQIASTEQNRARIHLEEFSTSVNGLQAEINGFATEVTSRVNLTGAKGQAVQAFISTAQAYINEAQANLSLASGYNNAVGAYLNAAQGYAAEIQAYVTSSQMFIGTASNRINVGNAFLAEANARAGEASAYIGEINGRATQIQSQLSVAQGYVQTGAGYSRVADGYGKTAQGYLGTAATYLSAGQGFASTAQGYVNEVTSKINIASSYLQEMQARLAVDNSKYTWYTQQYQMIDAQYKEQIETLRGII